MLLARDVLVGSMNFEERKMVTVQEITEIVNRLRADYSASESGEEIGATYKAAIDKLEALAILLKTHGLPR